MIKKTEMYKSAHLVFLLRTALAALHHICFHLEFIYTIFFYFLVRDCYPE